MEALLGLLLVFAALVIVPLLILKLFLHLLIGLVLLPFKILGGLFRLLGGIVGFAGKLIGLGFGLVGGMLAMVLALILLPLLPFLVVIGGLWLLVRLCASTPPVRIS